MICNQRSQKVIRGSIKSSERLLNNRQKDAMSFRSAVARIKVQKDNRRSYLFPNKELHGATILTMFN